MKEIVLFVSGALAGGFALFALTHGWGAWPADKRRARKSSDASWLR